MGYIEAVLEALGLGGERGKSLCLIARFGRGGKAEKAMRWPEARHSLGWVARENLWGGGEGWSREHSGIGSLLF